MNPDQKTAKPTDPNRVAIFDTTLRDGEQAPGFSMDLGQKLRMAKGLLGAKVDIIEAGFPVASPGDFSAVKAIATAAADNRVTKICGLARANEADIIAAGEAIAPAGLGRIHTFIATSPIHREYKLRMSKDEVLERAIRSVKHAKSLAEEVEFSAEDAIRTERDYLAQVFSAAIGAGATIINVPDTVGYTTPDEIEDLFRWLIAHVDGAEEVTFSAHCHDDLGMAVANSLAAVRGGARQIECAVNGIGERAGNCATEEVVMALHTRADHFGVSTGIDTTKLYNLSGLLESLTGQAVPRNKAIVGENAFAHESGIHQDGVLKNIETYEIMKPEDVGQPSSKLIMGKHSGRNALADRAKNIGFNLAGERLDAVFEAFKKLADRKKEITEDDLKSLILGKAVINTGPWRVLDVKSASDRTGKSTARVILEHASEGRREAQASANGVVEAAFTAARSIIGLNVKVEDFSIRAVGEGMDALGQASVRIRELGAKSKIVTGGDGGIDRTPTINGSGLHTDIVIASVIAYLDAMNRLVRAQNQAPVSS
ncbi:MAG: 2-isopropylmalate synthase [Parvularculaceae bacterium]